MLIPKRTKKFEKDLKRCQKRAKDTDKLKAVMNLLIHQKPLPASQRDHKLVGNYVDCRECHIEPDWLLVYRKTDTYIVFEATGSHADLF